MGSYFLNDKFYYSFRLINEFLFFFSFV